MIWLRLVFKGVFEGGLREGGSRKWIIWLLDSLSSAVGATFQWQGFVVFRWLKVVFFVCVCVCVCVCVYVCVFWVI